MVCDTCRNMLSRQEGRFAKGTLDLKYEHHTNARTFQQSVQQNCYICRALYISLQVQLEHNAASQPRRDFVVSSALEVEEQCTLSELAQQSLRSTASLFLQELDRTYRLEFELTQNQVRIQHTFHLERRQETTACPDQHSVHVRYRKPEEAPVTSRNALKSSRHRDYETASRWLKECKCYAPRPRSFYPTRLISLENVKVAIETYGNSTPYPSSTEVIINLVETDSWLRSGGKEAGYNGGNKHYVTLSHCWGGIVSHRLVKSNYGQFIQGIPVDDLPKTFRDAVYFAASLEEVGYIWIDSLCIIQGDPVDWLQQSADMDRVYSETFLNLSATAALNSNGGLFRDGDCELLEEEEVPLNIEGLPLAYDREALPKCLHDKRIFLLRHCAIMDTSFWVNEVDKGPVNMRGWVLQERLMSPRVLHFCHDQVGWECACCDVIQASAAIETNETGTASEQSRYRNIVEGIRQRLMAANNGAETGAPTAYSPFDLWAAVVNAYSKTAISHSQDKLIALSGLAKIIAEGTGCAYVAGLWRTHLASQLLWYVVPVYHPTDRSFSHQATCPDKDRAPSFSWAAIDVTGYGVRYAKVTDRGMFIRIEDTFLETPTNNEFGLISEARIILWGRIREARLVSIPNNRFGWHLVGREDLDDELHKNVYLDCPLRDADCIDNTFTPVYVLLVAREVTYAGTSKNEHLLCLILRSEQERGTFKRIGMTKLSPFGDRKAMKSSKIDGKAGYKILEAGSSDTVLPHDGYNQESGMHRICLV